MSNLLSSLLFVYLLLVAAVLCSHSLPHSSNKQQVLLETDEAIHACHLLASNYPNQTISPSNTQYPHDQRKYWSLQQSSLHPACRFLPLNPLDIRTALQTLYTSNATFAIASGGHTSNTGFSNADNGVTIDLSQINQVNLADNDGVWIGAGARWGDVYCFLEPFNLTVAGARASQVGVGGFILGGGICFFANQVGWSSDSVQEFELVTPDLEIRHVDRINDPDLFWALKGSAGSLGIVTAIKLTTLPTKGVFAGTIAFSQHHVPHALEILTTTTRDAESDPLTSTHLTIGYLPSQKSFVYTASTVNTANKPHTPSLNLWTSIPNSTAHLTHTTLSQTADEISRNNPLGYRRAKFSLTTPLHLPTLTRVAETFQTFAQNLNIGSEGLVGMEMQPLTTPMLEHTHNIFTEALGTEARVVVAVEAWWVDAGRDGEVEEAMRELERRLSGEGVGKGWVYPNYAAAWQEVFSPERMGGWTMGRLREVRREYDPEGLWTRLRAGGWKI